MKLLFLAFHAITRHWVRTNADWTTFDVHP